MTTHHPTSSVDVVLTAGESRPLGRPAQDIPFRMLLMGNFSGRESSPEGAGRRPPITWRPLRVDRDNLQTMPGKLSATLEGPLLGENTPPITLRFTDLDDFHPDRLVCQIEPLQKLSDLRRRLTNPVTFSAAADEVREWTQPPSPTEARSVGDGAPPHQAGVTGAPMTSLLDQVLEQAPISVADLRLTEWQSYLQSLIQPLLVPKEHPLEKELVAQVDEAMSQILRTLLHHPTFQELRTAWLGLSFLVDRLETDQPVQLYLLDLPKSDLSADLLRSDDLQATQLYRLLVQETVHTFGAHPWAVIGGVYTFDRTTEDVQMLERIAKVSQEAGAPFLAAASPCMVGCSSFGSMPDPDDWQSPTAHQESQQQWERLRRMDQASYLGLSLPRFLLRLPFGPETEAISAFEFEEMAGIPDHEHYCWGNPIFASLLLLGKAFLEESWHLRPGSVQDIDGLPLHVYRDETGDSVTTPCAEAWLTEQAAERLLEAGLMPLLSYKNQDRVRLVRFQSIALPLKPLLGRWSEAG
ncbi:MAG TPA: type VI secretion system contractile sheath large subunit [Nitrospira sp.]|nr:type VI secretion system contractile sheath large subunit [Nitrospira sp.]